MQCSHATLCVAAAMAWTSKVNVDSVTQPALLKSTVPNLARTCKTKAKSKH